MAVFVVINYFGIRWFARINNALVWWKIAIILLVIAAFLISAFHGENFTEPRVQAPGVARHLHRDRHLGDRVLLPRVPAGHRARRRDRQPQAQRSPGGGGLGPDHRADLHRVAVRLHRRRSTPALLDKSDGGWSDLSFKNDFGPLAALASLLGLGWLAILLYVDAIVSPGDTGLIYTTVTSRISYAMARNGNAPEGAGPDDRSRCAPDLADRHLRRRAHRLPALPELAAAGRLHHLGDGPLLRLGAARPVGAAQAAARPRATLPRPGRPRHPASSPSGRRTSSSTGPAGTSSGSWGSPSRSVSSSSRSTTCSARTPPGSTSAREQRGSCPGSSGCS